MFHKIKNYIINFCFVLKIKIIMLKRKLTTGKSYQMSKRGEQMAIYCAKVVKGEDKNRTYAETIFEEKIMDFAKKHNCTRTEAATTIGLMLFGIGT